MNRIIKDCIRQFGITALLVLEMVQQTAGAPRCREGYYWLSLAGKCDDCSNICYPGSTYIQSCWDFCGQTIPPLTTTIPPPVTNQTTFTIASTIPPIAGVVQPVMDRYAVYIILSVVVFVGFIFIIALIYRHKVRYLVSRAFRSICPIHASLPTQGAQVYQTDLAHHPNGIALENAHGIPVPCNNDVVQHNGSVLQSRVAVQNGFRHQNGYVHHEGVAQQSRVAVQNGYHYHNGIIQQGLVNGQQNGAAQQGLVNGQQNGAAQQGLVNRQQNGAAQQGLVNGQQNGAAQQGLVNGQQNGAAQQGLANRQQNGAVQQGIFNPQQNGAVQQGIFNPQQNSAVQQGIFDPQQNGAVQQGLVNSQPNGTIHQHAVANQYENRAMPSYDASVMNTDNSERQHLLSDEIPPTNHQQARQSPTATTSNARGASQSLLDSDNDATDDESESNDESPIGSTKMFESKLV